jgi:uncharacterized membrane protein YqjE
MGVLRNCVPAWMTTPDAFAALYAQVLRDAVFLERLTLLESFAMVLSRRDSRAITGTRRIHGSYIMDNTSNDISRSAGVATGMAKNRPVTDVLQDVVGNVQEILRSEFQLARTEIKEEAVEASRPAAILGAGVVLAAYAVGLLLLAAVYALAQVVTIWAAALVVGGAVDVAAILLIMLGRNGLRRVNLKLETTIASLKENMR